MEYLLHLLILVGIYVMLSQSLSLSAGFGGMISLAHAGFYGVGAYTATLLAVNYFINPACCHVIERIVGIDCICNRFTHH
ncbi:hypothetical protein AGMMS49574_22600 [Bacteroidia bacterium]|nr:hypothetical protein AGMMS49574_22600 [Bacteroidia bacterium]GHV03845.1 hypothetical protein FACS189416_0970 [Bacteroidia bacterium]